MRLRDNIVPHWKRQHAKINSDITRWAKSQFEYERRIDHLCSMDEEEEMERKDFKRIMVADTYVAT